MSERDLPYLAGYPEAFREKVRGLIVSGKLSKVLSERYPGGSSVQTDSQLRDYVMALKNDYLKRSSPLSKICFDDKISTLHGALGLHSYVSRVQGGKTKAKNELRVATIFKTLPEAFLRMVVVHELAHLREKDHNKAFYQLCCHMEADYHQLEMDLRLLLTVRDCY
jgi:predicted metal-dependent hydrolase